MTIKEPEKYKVTFNFFNGKSCDGFTFCQSFIMSLDYILKLVEMSDNERLEELTEFLTHDRKGKSCEFYWRGSFYKARKVDEELQNIRLEKMRLARKNKNSGK